MRNLKSTKILGKKLEKSVWVVRTTVAREGHENFFFVFFSLSYCAIS